ncbi:3-dehydroquinate synthase [Thermosporothrix hazakensis]|uniref:Multifunctional fusion protein n=2 Tax=Thermosporothrix hazakensis TaxID=644383 RepID=A0A326UE98_THEHA|nr:3-dehydroquinate synthase [Thermosporothrix hazakensis]GCE46821.1 hypothetical protein KTH_16900 [Thermosporothrix hazakensis]
MPRDTIAYMRNVFLIGLSGSGKSTIARLLAQRLQRPLFDLDLLIEQKAGMSIPAIFAQHGERYFRECERVVLAEAVQQQAGAVIATGGGIVSEAANRALMSEHGVRVFLYVEPEVALQRLLAQHRTAIERGEQPETRPLLEGSDPLARLQNLLALRHQWYAEAEHTCHVQGKSVEQITSEIIAMLVSSGALEGAEPLVRHIQAGSGYDAIVEWGGLGRLPQYLKQVQASSRVFLFTDSHLAPLYADTLLQNLTGAGFEPHLYVVPAGEESKSMAQLGAIYDWLVEQRAERRETLIAFGGGVIGDLIGFVAASYLRGVPLVQVPTSLLAQVDSAIGGKTGINHPRGKNLIGAFYHPRLVLADPAVLLTLPVRPRTEGWAEIVKYGMIVDAELFSLLEAHQDSLREFSPPPVALLSQIIARSIDLKASVIESDEREQGLRAILNYGHTIGHALESVAGYGEWLHGEAVSLGMVAAAAIAYEAGMFSAEEMARQNALLAALGLPTEYRGDVRAEDILAKIQLDKKVVGKRVRWIMPRRIGEVEITEMPDELVTRVVTAFFGQKKGSQGE